MIKEHSREDLRQTGQALGGRPPIAMTKTIVDPDEFTETIAPGTGVQITIRKKLFGAQRVTRLLPDLFLARGQMSAPVAVRVGIPRRASFGLAATPGAEMVIDGQAHPFGTLRWPPPGGEVLSADPGCITWWTYSFPLHKAAERHAALFGSPLRVPVAITRIEPIPPWRNTALLDILACIMTLQPAPLTLQEELLRLTMEAFDTAAQWVPPLSATRRRAIVDDLIGLADHHAGEAVPLADVCTALGVPARTLNAASNAVLGISAAAYLRSRRMSAARSWLASGDASDVTTAATRHGFYELGRFATQYRGFFGELPSDTLRRARTGRMAK